MTSKKTTATVAAKAVPVKNSETENVTVTNSGDASAVSPTAGTDAGVDQSADIAPATEINTSGAPQQIVPDVDLSHPAVDSDPRKGTSIAQNKIDFNDPTIPGYEAVEDSLKKD